MIRAASFDVFDSALVRDVLVPSDVFPRIGKRLLRDSAARLSATEFGRLRVLAETRARTATPHEDITLEEIWRQLAPMLAWDWDSRLLDAEMAEEAACLAPVETTRRLIESARARYGRVLFVSDSYFPRSFIRAQLERFGLMSVGDRLYVSSELRLTKSSGSLFSHILKCEQLEPKELIHYGDNPESDVRVPRSIGIRARRVAVPELTRNETALLERPLTGLVPLRDITGASRQFRMISSAEGSEAGSIEAAGSFLGPFCGLFAAWALSAAARHGLRRLYFCSRDCQLTWKAARVLASRYGDIDCRYLYVSRQSLFLASIEQVSRKDLHWLRRPFERPLLERILAKIEIDPREWKSHFEGIGTQGPEGTLLGAESDWDRLWSALESPPIREAIAARASERRAQATAYFESVGLLDDPLAGIVDIGWHLTCQAALRRIMRAAGRRANEVIGFYLQLNGDRAPPAESGPVEFLFTEPAPDVGRFGRDVTLQHMDAFLEHVVGQATHPSTTGYAEDKAGRWQPVLAGTVVAGEDLAAVEPHHRAVEEYVRRYAPRIVAWGEEPALLPFVMQRVGDSFFRSASSAAAASLGHVLVTVEQNSLDSHELLRPISWWDAFRPILPSRMLGTPYRDPYHPWPRGRRLITPRTRNAAFAFASRAARLRSRFWRFLRHAW